jgi:hypothetical protein
MDCAGRRFAYGLYDFYIRYVERFKRLDSVEQFDAEDTELVLGFVAIAVKILT